MSRVIVGVDGSEGSIRALRFAVEEARIRGAELMAVNAWHIPPAVYDSGWAPAPIDLDEYRKLAQKALEASLVEAGVSRRRRRRHADPARGPAGRRPLSRGRGRRPPRRRLARPRRLSRPAARLGEPAGRPPRALPGRGRPGPHEADEGERVSPALAASSRSAAQPRAARRPSSRPSASSPEASASATQWRTWPSSSCSASDSSAVETAAIWVRTSMQ